ncbi:MAG: EVE domain-containing protein [Deltaproteobacteria bacterium]|nr:EVE domain-containing protein [Deltaproteobacteria bacterium]
MARAYWLVKSEPSTYAWQDLLDEGRTVWDGVRNPSARQHLGAMGARDLVLFYHSGAGKEVVGIARVARTAYPDPADGAWLAVDLEPVAPLVRPVTLAAIKADAGFRGFALVRMPRLSVLPVSPAHFERILALAGTKAPRR